MTKPFAVVTGASSGIGLEIAAELEQREYDVLRFGKEDADLSTPDGVQKVVRAVEAAGRPIDALVLNAGRGAGGEFVGGTELADEFEIIDVNCRSTVHLAKLLLPSMVGRGEGRVLITSSIASTMPGTYQAVYNASKSFTQAFSLALREELADTGVTVTALMPGPTDTDFFEVADMEDTEVGAGDKDDPAQVAEQAVKGMLDGDERVLGGSISSRLQGKLSRLLPDSVKAKAHAKMAEPGSAD